MMKIKSLYLSFFFLVFSCCFLTSCRSTQRQDVQKIETKTESVSEKVVTYKDTTLYAPKAETAIKIPISHLGIKDNLNGVKKPVYYTQKNAQASVNFKAENDTIYVVVKCDSLAIVAKIKKEFQQSANNKSDSNQQSSNKKVKSGYSIFELIGAFALGFIICFLLKSFK